jgi:ribosomal protein L32
MLWRTLLQWTTVRHRAAYTVTRHIQNQGPPLLLLPFTHFQPLYVTLMSLPPVSTTTTSPSTTLVTPFFSSTLSKLLLDIAIWLAVPKRKHTKSRKRKKTTVHKRIPLQRNIVFDPPTGEITLKHKLPYKWKELYTLPKMNKENKMG